MCNISALFHSLRALVHTKEQGTVEESRLSFSLKAFSLSFSAFPSKAPGTWAGGQALHCFVNRQGRDWPRRQQRGNGKTSQPPLVPQHFHISILTHHFNLYLFTYCTYLHSCVLSRPNQPVEGLPGMWEGSGTRERSERRSKELRGKRYHWGNLTGLLSNTSRRPI